MAWWDPARKEAFYNRLHAGGVYFLLGLTFLGVAVIGKGAYNILTARNESKKEYIEGKLPEK